jgi:anaerobic selenocysteine-containing dehydrogenase
MLFDGANGLADVDDEPKVDATAKQGLRAGSIDGRDSGRPRFEASRILALPDAMVSGKPYPAKILLLHHSNPGFSKPGGKRWLEAMAKVPLVVSFSPLMDESALLADLVLPDHTFLERWDVVSPGRGTRALSISQPVVRPLGNAMQTGEVIIRLARSLGGAVAEALPWHRYSEAVEAWLAKVAGEAEGVMAELESRGVWIAPAHGDGPAAEREVGRRQIVDVTPALLSEVLPASADRVRFPFVIVPFRGPGYSEGGLRHLPWLCELPLAARDAWRPYVEISPQDARGLGIEDGDGVVVESPFARVAMQARISEGIKPGVLGLPLGGGAWPVAAAEPMASSLLGSLADESTGQWLACATRARLGKGA